MAEFRPAFRKDREDAAGFLGIVRIAECVPHDLYRSTIWAGLDPSLPDEAFERILLRTLTGPQTPAVGTLNNLPNLTTRVHGREEDMFHLTASLSGGNAAINQQAVRGLGGIGKTTLALAFAHSEDAKRRFPIRWWVLAETRESVEAALHAFALRMKLAAEETPPEQAVTATLNWFRDGQRDALIIFNNVENPKILTDFGPHGAHILATTRRQTLGGVKIVELGTWDKATTTAFLMERTGDNDAEAAEALAIDLGGLPLAAEHSAAICQATGMGLAAYHQMFRARTTDALDHLIADHDYPTPVARTFLVALEAAEAEVPGAKAMLSVMANLSPEQLPVAVFLHEEAPEGLGDLAKVEAAIATLRKHALVGRERLADEVHPDDPARQVDCLSAHRLVLQAAQGQGNQGQAIWALSGAFKGDETSNIEARPLYRRLETHADPAWAEREWIGEEADVAARALDRSATILEYAHADYRRARDKFSAALKISEAAHGPDHPNVAILLSNLANVLRDLGRDENLKAARAALERALKIDEAALGSDHPKVGIRCGLIARMSVSIGAEENLVFAREMAQRAVDVHEKSLGVDHPYSATSRSIRDQILLGHAP